VQYPYLLEADHHAYAGHVAHDARHGERVTADLEEAGGNEKLDLGLVLRVRFQLRTQQVSNFVIRARTFFVAFNSIISFK